MRADMYACAYVPACMHAARPDGSKVHARRRMPLSDRTRVQCAHVYTRCTRLYTFVHTSPVVVCIRTSFIFAHFLITNLYIRMHLYINKLLKKKKN